MIERCIKELSSAVLMQCARDLQYGCEIAERTEKSILNGDCDLYFDILNLNMSKTEFIEKSKKETPKKKNITVTIDNF